MIQKQHHKIVCDFFYTIDLRLNELIIGREKVVILLNLIDNECRVHPNEMSILKVLSNVF